MPIYEYVCRECGAELEKLQGLSDPAPVDCPACSAPALRRKLSAAGFRLAGGGWYETDFKQDGRRNLAGDNKKEAGEGTGKSESNKSSEKPAKKDAPAKTGAKEASGKRGAASDKKAQSGAGKGGSAAS